MFLALPVTPASAHAAYKESSPADKSTVSAPPTEVWAEFTEPPAQSSKLEIYDPCGERVDSGSASIVAYRMTTTMNSDKQGTYTASFYVTSDLDSHVTTGSFTFTSTSGAPCSGSEPEENPQGDGGGGGGGGDDPASAGAGDDPGAGSGNASAAAAATSKGSRKGGKHSGMKHGPGGGKNEGSKASAKSPNRSEASGPPLEQDESVPVSNEPVSSEIPMDWLMISFGIAGVVGAAGGKVYAGLMGAPKT